MTEVTFPGGEWRYSGGMRGRTFARRHFLKGGLSVAGLGLLSGCGLNLPFGLVRPSMRRIGIVDLGEDEINWSAFRGGMRERGWVEGEIIIIESHWAEGDETRFAANVAELDELGIE